MCGWKCSGCREQPESLSSVSLKPSKASPERGGARDLRAEGFVPQRRTVAAALSAAVTSTYSQTTAPNSHGREPPKEQPSLFPATLREGVRGRRFS